MTRMMTLLPLLALGSLAACGYGSHDEASWDGSYGAAPSETALQPLEEPLDDEEPIDASCDVDAPVTLYVSPDDSNSMSSPVQAREAALDGDLHRAPIRTWEFFNYAQWDYPPAAQGELDVHLALAEGDEAGDYTLQVGIASEQIDPDERDPIVLTFSIDQSCSMSGAPMDRVKDSLVAVAGQLRQGDLVNLLGWSNGQHVYLDGHTITGPNDPAFVTAAKGLNTDGGTDLAGGLKAAYRMAETYQTSGVINRVVLMSDGGANIGITDEELIGGKAGANDEQGIYLIGVGTGTASTYNDVLMDRVTDLGRGSAVFIPSKAEAQHVFGDRFLETMATTARDVQIRYDLPPGFEVVRFSGEEISTDPEEVQPQHVAPNDAVVLHQQLHTCDPAVDLDAEVTVTVSYLDGVTFAPREATVSATLGELLAVDDPQLLKGAAVFAYAETLRHLRGDDSMAEPGEAWTTLEAAEAANPGDADLAGIREVLDALGI